MEFSEFIKTPTVDNVILHKPYEFPIEGTLCVTGYYLILSSRQEQKEEVWILYNSIDSIEKKLSGAGGTLTIRCKDFSVIQMDIPTAEACINIASSVELLSNIDDVALLYPFFLSTIV